MSVLIFSQILSATILLLRRMERDIIINVYWYLCNLFYDGL
jgi:hypothetical protein